MLASDITHSGGDDGTDTDDAHTQQLGTPTQKVICGWGTQSRKSPGSATKKDYKALEDSIIETTILYSDGEKVFPKDYSDGKDSVASDRGYSGEDEDSIEIEEAV